MGVKESKATNPTKEKEPSNHKKINLIFKLSKEITLNFYLLSEKEDSEK
jgi:hypothetical protein